MDELIFPDFEKLEELKLFTFDSVNSYSNHRVVFNKEFSFMLFFEYYENTYCRIIYNKSGNKQFCLEVCILGFSNRFEFENNIVGYKLMRDKANIVYDRLISYDVIRSNKTCSEKWFKEMCQ